MPTSAIAGILPRPELHAPVAQLDRVSASEAEGHRFKSCRARQIPIADTAHDAPTARSPKPLRSRPVADIISVAPKKHHRRRPVRHHEHRHTGIAVHLNQPPPSRCAAMLIKKLQRLTVRNLVLPLFKSKHTPEFTARGAAIGLAIAMTPLVGMQMPLTLLSWVLIRTINKNWDFNLPVALAYNWVTNVLTVAPFYYVFFITGRLMMGEWQALTGFTAFSAQLQASLAEELVWHQTIWVYTMELFKSFGVPMFIGCLPWMILSAWLGYRYTLKLIVQRQAQRKRLRERRAHNSRR